MDGLDIIKYLKSRDMLKRIPVIAIAADSLGERSALETGAADVLIEPLNTNILSLRMKNTVNTAKIHEQRPDLTEV